MKKILILVILMSSLACRNHEAEAYTALDRSLEKTIPDAARLNSRYCIVIPRVGCGGCIDHAVEYLNSKMDSLKGVTIIVTGITDLKLLKLELGNQFIERKNVYLDTPRAFQDIRLVSPYPQIVSMKNGKATEIHELDVYSEDMRKLVGRE
jgi:hypothetical protein